MASRRFSEIFLCLRNYSAKKNPNFDWKPVETNFWHEINSQSTYPRWHQIMWIFCSPIPFSAKNIQNFDCKIKKSCILKIFKYKGNISLSCFNKLRNLRWMALSYTKVCQICLTQVRIKSLELKRKLHNSCYRKISIKKLFFQREYLHLQACPRWHHVKH